MLTPEALGLLLSICAFATSVDKTAFLVFLFCFSDREWHVSEIAFSVLAMNKPEYFRQLSFRGKIGAKDIILHWMATVV